MVKTQASSFYRIMLGDFEITALSDGTVDLPVDKLLSEPAAKTDAILKKSYLSSPLEVSDNAFLINTDSRLVLVDTDADTLSGPTLGNLLASLRAAGYGPEQVIELHKLPHTLDHQRPPSRTSRSRRWCWFPSIPNGMVSFQGWSQPALPPITRPNHDKEGLSQKRGVFPLSTLTWELAKAHWHKD